MTQRQSEICFVKSNWDLISGIHRFSHEAMATTFEVIILHEDARYAQQAAWAAFDELGRLEAELSRFIENSDISRINNLAANQPLQIGLAAFECLQLCARIYAETNGAFDITIGSLLGCWVNEDETMRIPSEEQLNLARQCTGLQLLRLDEAEHTVHLLTDSVQIDLGGFGKGYAVDQMGKLLREWSIDTALIHGGGSSVLALGGPPGGDPVLAKRRKMGTRTKGWPLTLSSPGNHKQTLARFYLQDRALSGSGLQKGHLFIDPRTAQPVENKRAAWACASTAATADALSTAFMLMSPDEVNHYCLSHSDVLAMIVMKDQGREPQKDEILRYGHWD